MPEGPEIRRAADELASVLRARKITEVTIGLPRLRPARRHIEKATVMRVDSHGKAMLTQFSSGMTLYSHNQLYGVWRIVTRGELPETNRALRIGLHTEQHSALLYSATDIELWETRQLENHPFLKKLGPDLLDEKLTAALVTDRLLASRFVRRSLGALYLDQGFIAGVGNYLRSEILHFAGLAPRSRPVDLTRQQLSRLGRVTLQIGQRSYKTAGLTLPAAKVRELAREGADFENSRFAVFDRDGDACYQCGTEVIRDELSARRIYWCPACQAG